MNVKSILIGIFTGCFFTMIPEKSHADPINIDALNFGEWIIEYERNRYGYYVHSRDVTLNEIRCQQTRIGKVSLHGDLQPPLHIFWSGNCNLPLPAITHASKDVDRHLSLYAVITRHPGAAE